MTQPTLRRLGAIAVIALAVLLPSVALLAYNAIAARAALCSFTHDLETRIDKQQELLDTQEGPTIDVFAGQGDPRITLIVPRTVIENQVASQRATLSSITGGWPNLKC